MKRDPIVPDRWAHEVGVACCAAALIVAVMAAGAGEHAVTLVAVFYALTAIALVVGGSRMARRERW